MRTVEFGRCGMRPDGQIEPGYCGLPRELRPYGKNGLAICISCGLRSGEAFRTIHNMRRMLWRIVWNRWVKHPRERRA